jgi:esterase/lipase
MQKILLLHGALGCANDLLPLAEELKKKGFDPLIPEYQGHGRTPASERLSIHSLCHQLRTYIKEQQLEKAPVLGYSLGGYLALLLAADNTLKGPLITLATKLQWTAETAQREAANCNEERLRSKAPAFYAGLQQTHVALSDLLKQTANYLLHMHATPPPAPDQLKNPVLLLRGELDKMVSMEETLLYRQSLAAGQLGLLPATAHALSSAAPALLAQHIVTFVKTCGSDAVMDKL